MTNEASSNAIIGNTLRIIASGEYHPGAELTQKMASYIIELEQKLTDMAVQLANAEIKCRELAAENAEMRSSIDATIGWQESTDPENGESVRMLVDIKTPATDAFLAEVRAQARNELIDELESRFNEMTETLPPELRSGAAGAAAFVSTFRKGAAL